MMEFDGEFTVDGTPAELWPYFTDPDVLREAAPGCESITLQSPSRFTATLTVGVGSVKPSFDVEGVVVAADEPHRMEVRATGEASRNSFQATAVQELHDNGDGTTTVDWHAEAEVSGIIASMGERALGSVTNSLVDEFFQNLEDQVTAGAPAESKLEAASDEAVEAATAGDDRQARPATPDDTGFGSPGTSLGVGVVIGVVGTVLWNWLRGGRDGDDDVDAADGPDSTAEPAGSSGGTGLTAAILLAFGAIGAILWNRARGDDTGPLDVGTATTGDEVTLDDPTDRASATGETTTVDGETAVSGVEDHQQTGEEIDETTETGDGPDADDGRSDNPLDRLESR